MVEKSQHSVGHGVVEYPFEPANMFSPLLLPTLSAGLPFWTCLFIKRHQGGKTDV